jgi:hypothetical protein
LALAAWLVLLLELSLVSQLLRSMNSMMHPSHLRFLLASE